MSDSSKNMLFCSFCDKSQQEVKKLIAGPNIFICDECVILCQEILSDSSSEISPSSLPTVGKKSVPTPQSIYSALGEYVIGQHHTKKVLSVAVHNHYKRIEHVQEDKNSTEISKSNILLIGSTGSGKTLMAQTLAKILDVPFTIADATTLTEAGYVGEDVENIILRLVQAANYNIAKAERGIIYIDEIDKITRKSDQNPSITRDVSGEGVQHALLSILEGKKAMVPPQGGRKHPQQDFLQVNTQNILFICGGAFEGLERIVHARMSPSCLGFSTGSQEKEEKDEKNLADMLRSSDDMVGLFSKDLPKFGLIPELIGRLPVIAVLDTLKESDLIQILQEPKNALIKQFQVLFQKEGVDLSFTLPALKALAQRAVKTKTGARGLRTMLESLLMEDMFHLPDRQKDKAIEKMIVHASSITNEEPIECIYKDEEPKKTRSR